MDAITQGPLPEASSMLAGRGPVDPHVGVLTDRVQIYWRRSDDLREDARSHTHERSDEFFVVFEGAITFDVEGDRRVVGARSFCHFPVGVFHRVASVTTPLEALVIRAPSVEDKLHR